MVSYRHTQVGWLTIVVTLAALASCARVLGSEPLAATGVGLLVIAVGVVFSSLTIEVNEGELRSHFGPGVWRKRFPLPAIAAAAPTTSRWWEGWGIRITPRGMLYNVSGTRAVEVVLRSGDRFRLGTDEPDALAAAIAAARAEQG